MNDRDCIALLQWALPRMHLRWRGFSNLRGQVCKRIGRRMRELGLTDVGAYRALLERDADEWARLDSFCRVTISRFFRDRAVFGALGDVLLPELGEAAVAEGRPLRIWSAGSSSGEEPYTVVLVLRFAVAPRLPDLRYEVIASEVDPVLLERAREASYPRGALRELPPEWTASAFEEAEDGELRLRDTYRDEVQFRHEDVRRSLPEGPFDVVLCRNVAFTYFDVELQERFLRDLLPRLRSGGLLVLGQHERLPEGADVRFGLHPAHGALPIFRFSGPSGPRTRG